MKFETCATETAAGGLLAHSQRAGNRRIAKGTLLGESEIATLLAAGIKRVDIARLEPGDVDELRAAEAIGAALSQAGLEAQPPSAGRVNIIARNAGLLRCDPEIIDAINATGEDVSLATLADESIMAPGELAASVKIIPYGIAQDQLGQALKTAGKRPALTLHSFRTRSVSLIQTTRPDLKPSLIVKGRAVIEARLAPLGLKLDASQTCPHDRDALAECLAGMETDWVLILGAAATSDRGDIIPAAIEQAKGRVERFGMPVDPGNLLVLGAIENRQVIGLPGCARSPAPNGADRILARLAAGQPGHPVLFTRRHFEELMALRGDRGAAELIRSHADRLAQLVLPGRAASLDLDTPEDWARFETTGE